MTQPPTGNPTTPEIVRPIFRDPDPDVVIENVFPLPGTEDLRDVESQDRAIEYAHERFEPYAGPKTRLVWTPSGYTMPGVARVPDGYKEVRRWHLPKTEGWFLGLSPRKAIAIMVGSMALFNVIGNHGTIDGAAHYVSHTVDRDVDGWLGENTDTIYQDRPIRTPGKVSEIHEDVATTTRVGTTEIDPTSPAIVDFVSRVKDAEAHGSKILKINITGNTSDEWTSESSIGRPDPGNAELDKVRAEAAAEALAADGLKVPAHKLEVNGQQNVLTPPEKQAVDRTARQDGYPDIMSAVSAADRGQKLPARLARQIKQLFTGRHLRGVSINAEIEHQGQATVRDHFVPLSIDKPNHKPDVPKPHWYWFIPIIPIRRRRIEEYNKVKELKRWEFTTSQPILKPEILREEDDQVWLRLYQEAANDDGSLPEDAWSYTRSYANLIREGRITDLVKAEFQDANGVEKAIRVYFVDKSPAQETIDAFEALLHKLAAMDDGKLADRLSAMIVYPSETAGTAHGDPKQMNMGLDKQSDANILGTYTYPLNLVELHMPASWDPEELLAMFETFNGPMWVAAHEGTHALDRTGAQQRTRRVKGLRGIANAYVLDGEPRGYMMRPLDEVVTNLPEDQADKDLRGTSRFDIRYSTLDLYDQPVDSPLTNVDEADSQLAHALEATIVGRRPTQYAGTNTQEHAAEVGASVITGIEIPFSEALVSLPRLRTRSGRLANFVTGFRPDRRSQDILTRTAGATTGEFPISFAETPEVRISHIHPENDRQYRAQLSRLTQQRFPQPENMIAILARVARTRKR